MPRQIAILGSTGSIGTQALDIVRRNPTLLQVHTLVAGNNAPLLIEQAIEFAPHVVVIGNSQLYNHVHQSLAPRGIRVEAGANAIEEAMLAPEIEVVLTAMVGFGGLRPTLSAIGQGKVIALCNKETLVVAGELIIDQAHRSGARIIPVDSEHSAIYQCLVGEGDPVERIILTASGGPFRGMKTSQLAHVTPQQALKHPNWSMGAKVSVDSASLMNKGLEMIEARWLFDLPPSQIEVLIHPQSIVHSMVEFEDGSIKAQLGIPDMRIPIAYALGLASHIPNTLPRLDLTAQSLSFQEPDLESFPNLTLAYRAIELGGNAPCVLNAANEIAVEAFLKGELKFLGMSRLLEDILSSYTIDPMATSLEHLEHTDAEVRRLSRERISRYSQSH